MNGGEAIKVEKRRNGAQEALGTKYYRSEAVRDMLYTIGVIEDIAGLPFLADMPETGFLLSRVKTDVEQRLQVKPQD